MYLALTTGPAYLLSVVVIVAVLLYALSRNGRRRGRVARGAEVGPALDAALRDLVAGSVGFVVLSAGDALYLQFARDGRGMIAEANVPDGNPSAVEVVRGSGFTAVDGRPNYRTTIPNPSADSLVELSRRFFASVDTASVQVRTGR